MVDGTGNSPEEPSNSPETTHDTAGDRAATGPDAATPSARRLNLDEIGGLDDLARGEHFDDEEADGDDERRASSNREPHPGDNSADSADTPEEYVVPDEDVLGPLRKTEGSAIDAIEEMRDTAPRALADLRQRYADNPAILAQLDILENNNRLRAARLEGHSADSPGRVDHRDADRDRGHSSEKEYQEPEIDLSNVQGVLDRFAEDAELQGIVRRAIEQGDPDVLRNVTVRDAATNDLLHEVKAALIARSEQTSTSGDPDQTPVARKQGGDTPNPTPNSGEQAGARKGPESDEKLDPLDLTAINLDVPQSEASQILHVLTQYRDPHLTNPQAEMFIHALSSGDTTGIDTLMASADEETRGNLEKVKATLLAREKTIESYREVIDAVANDPNIIQLEEDWRSRGGQAVRGFEGNNGNVLSDKKDQLLKMRGAGYVISAIIAKDKGADTRSTDPAMIPYGTGIAVELTAGDPNAPHEYRYFALGTKSSTNRPFVGYYLQVPTSNTAVIDAITANPEIIFHLYRKKFDAAANLPPAIKFDKPLSTMAIEDLHDTPRKIIPQAFETPRQNPARAPEPPPPPESAPVLVQIPRPEERGAPEASETERGIRIAGASEASEEHPTINEDNMFWLQEKNAMGVFDGIGSKIGSERASEMAASIVSKRMANLPEGLSVTQTKDAIQEMLMYADNSINIDSAGNLGTTAAVTKIVEGPDGKRTAVIGTAGDSRVYLLRNGKLECLTIDDSVINGADSDAERKANQDRLSRAETLTRHERKARGAIYNNLGTGGATINLYTQELEATDVLIALTDGITDNLTEQQIEAILAENTDAAVASRKLVEAAQGVSRAGESRSKADDMTAVVMETGAQLPAQTAPEQKPADPSADRNSTSPDVSDRKHKGGMLNPRNWNLFGRGKHTKNAPEPEPEAAGDTPPTPATPEPDTDGPNPLDPFDTESDISKLTDDAALLPDSTERQALVDAVFANDASVIDEMIAAHADNDKVREALIRVRDAVDKRRTAAAKTPPVPPPGAPEAKPDSEELRPEAHYPRAEDEGIPVVEIPATIADRIESRYALTKDHVEVVGKTMDEILDKDELETKLEERAVDMHDLHEAVQFGDARHLAQTVAGILKDRYEQKNQWEEDGKDTNELEEDIKYLESLEFEMAQANIEPYPSPQDVKIYFTGRIENAQAIVDDDNATDAEKQTAQAEVDRLQEIMADPEKRRDELQNERKELEEQLENLTEDDDEDEIQQELESVLGLQEIEIKTQIENNIQAISAKIWQKHPDVENPDADPAKRSKILAQTRLLATIMHMKSRSNKAIIVGAAAIAGVTALRMGQVAEASGAFGAIGDMLGGSDAGIGNGPGLGIEEQASSSPASPPTTEVTGGGPIETTAAATTPSPPETSPPASSSGAEVPPETKLDPNEFNVGIELSHPQTDGDPSGAMLVVPKDPSPEQLKEITDQAGRVYARDADIPFVEARAEVADKLEASLAQGGVQVEVPDLNKVETIGPIEDGVFKGEVEYTVDLDKIPPGNEDDRVIIRLDPEADVASTNTRVDAYAQWYAEKAGIPVAEARAELAQALEAHGITLTDPDPTTTQPNTTDAPPASTTSPATPSSEAPPTTEPPASPTGVRSTEDGHVIQTRGTTVPPTTLPDGSPGGTPEGAPPAPPAPSEPNPGGAPVGPEATPPQVTPDQLREEVTATFADFDHTVAKNEGYSKIISEFVNSNDPTTWTNPENGVTKGAVIADMFNDFAKQNNIDLPMLKEGETINAAELFQRYNLTPDQIQVMGEAMQTTDVDSYLHDVQPRFEAVKDGTPLSEVPAITPEVPETPPPTTAPAELPENLKDEWTSFNHEAVSGDTRSKVYLEFFRDHADAMGGNWSGDGHSKAGELSNMWWNFQENHDINPHKLGIGEHVNFGDWDKFSPEEQDAFLEAMNSDSWEDYRDNVLPQYKDLEADGKLDGNPAPDTNDADTTTGAEATPEVTLENAQPIKFNLPTSTGFIEYTIDIPPGTTDANTIITPEMITDIQTRTGLPPTIAELMAINNLESGLQAQGIDVEIVRPTFDGATNAAIAQELSASPAFQELMTAKVFHYDGGTLWHMIDEQVTPFAKGISEWDRLGPVLTQMITTNIEANGLDMTKLTPGTDYSLADLGANPEQFASWVAQATAETSTQGYIAHVREPYIDAKNTW